MKNFVQAGNTVSFVAAAALESGAGFLLGADLFAVSCGKYAIGETGEAAIEGVFTLPKAAVVNTAFGPAYWDNTAKLVTNVSSGNKLIGAFTEGTAASIATAVKLIPKPV